METSPQSSSPDDSEAESAEDDDTPAQLIDGIYITDAQSWDHLKDSPHLFEKITFAIDVAQALQRHMADKKALKDALEEDDIRAAFSRIDHRTAFWSVMLLKKHWLYGEKLYEAYSTSRYTV